VEQIRGVVRRLFESELYSDAPLKVEACVAVLSEALSVDKEIVAQLRRDRKSNNNNSGGEH
jgi:hypothetical protein